jgi:hypothetical protein
MGAKEFLLKTGLFIILPGLVLYSCLRENESIVLGQAAQRACLNSLASSTDTALIIVGQADDGRLVYQPVADTAAKRRLQELATQLRPIHIQPGGYRPSLRRYRLLLASKYDTCEITIYKMPLGKADLLQGVGDSAYEAPKLISFLDSLLRLGVARQGKNAPQISQWLRN